MKWQNRFTTWCCKTIQWYGYTNQAISGLLVWLVLSCCTFLKYAFAQERQHPHIHKPKNKMLCNYTGNLKSFCQVHPSQSLRLTLAFHCILFRNCWRQLFPSRLETHSRTKWRELFRYNVIVLWGAMIQSSIRSDFLVLYCWNLVKGQILKTS